MCEERQALAVYAPPSTTLKTTHPEDAFGILHFTSGSEAYGRLDLTDKSPLNHPCGPYLPR
eukprot:384760-Pyramimonas_sp.AAC.1